MIKVVFAWLMYVVILVGCLALDYALACIFVSGTIEMLHMLGIAMTLTFNFKLAFGICAAYVVGRFMYKNWGKEKED